MTFWLDVLLGAGLGAAAAASYCGWRMARLQRQYLDRMEALRAQWFQAEEELLHLRNVMKG